MKKYVPNLILIMLVIEVIFIKPVYAAKQLVTVSNSLFSPSTSVDEPVIDSLSVSPTTQYVSADGGNTSFSVLCNSNWTTESSNEWCIPQPPFGFGNGTMTAYFSENTYVTQRIAHLNVSVSAFLYQWVTVIQAGASPALNVTPSNRNVTGAAGSTTFTVTSNTTWTTLCNASWCTVNPSGFRNGMITATYTANTTYETRTATITITVTGVAPQTVTVTQSASTVGYEEHAKNGFQVYPNPTRGLLKLSTGEYGDQPVTVNVVNLSGINIISGVYSGAGEYTFDLSQIPRGCYFVEIKTDSRTLIRRVVIID